MTPTLPKRLAPKNPSSPGTSDWLYNEIMRQIEPDLLSTAVGGLAAKYAGETAEQRQHRHDKYEQAYRTFDRIFAALRQTSGSADRAAHAALPIA